VVREVALGAQAADEKTKVSHSHMTPRAEQLGRFEPWLQSHYPVYSLPEKEILALMFSFREKLSLWAGSAGSWTGFYGKFGKKAGPFRTTFKLMTHLTVFNLLTSAIPSPLQALMIPARPRGPIAWQTEAVEGSKWT
jgi:hypothetical protein